MHTSKSLCIFLAIIVLEASSSITSGKNWKQYPARQNTYEIAFVKAILKFSLIEVEPIKFDSKEIELLSSTPNEFSLEKEAALSKFFRRMVVLQCNKALELHMHLSDFNVSLEGNVLDDVDDEIRQMLSIFYEAKSLVHNYFWLAHIGLVAYKTCNKHQGDTEYFANVFSMIEAKLELFSKECKEKNLLPSVTSFDLIKEKLGHNNRILEAEKPLVNKHLDLFNEWNYSLLFVADKLDQICQPIGKVNWNVTMEKMKVDIAACRNNSCQWCLDPYKHIDFHIALCQVVEATVFYRVLIHLMSYATLLGQNLSIVDGTNIDNNKVNKTKLSQFWSLLKEPLMMAISLFDVKNGVLWSLRHHMITKEIDVDTLDDMTKYILENLKNTLNDLHVADPDLVLEYIELETIKFNDNTDITSEKVRQNTADLKKYLLDVEISLRPANMPLILYFLSGQYDNKKDNVIFNNDNNAE